MAQPKHRKNTIVRTAPLVQPAGRHAGQFVGGKHDADSADDYPVVREFNIRDLMQAAFVGNPYRGGVR
jgi:hypothetical protein